MAGGGGGYERGVVVGSILSAVSIKHGLRTADCGLGIKYGLGIKCALRTEYKTRTRYKMRTKD